MSNKPLTSYQQQLVLNHLNKARACAKKWYKYDSSIQFSDYEQEARMGLIKAVLSYNEESTATLSSYMFKSTNGKICRMRSKWYTGYNEGFERDYPVPKFVSTDAPSPTNNQQEQDDNNSYNNYLGTTYNNYELREKLREIDYSNIEVDVKEINKQREKRQFLENIKAQMQEKKITITALAKKIGINQSTLSRWLSNTKGLNEKSKIRIQEALK